MAITETRETSTRKAFTDASLPLGISYFSSGIDARKGGIGILVKHEFMDQFNDVQWIVHKAGRLATLQMSGKAGRLNILVVYLDPSSKQQQLEEIDEIGKSIVAGAHNIVAGDFNFAAASGDRISKSTAECNGNSDQKQAGRWHYIAKTRGLREFQQHRFTCESSFGWSRIDRIYSDVHSANLIGMHSACGILEHRRRLSDHSPVSFELSYRKKPPKKDIIPPWIVHHEEFAQEVERNLSFFAQRNQQGQNNPIDELSSLKTAIKEASNYIRKRCDRLTAVTEGHKLACTISFIRAVETRQWVEAKRLQGKYSELGRQEVQEGIRNTEWFSQIKEHAVELMHKDIGDRIIELKKMS